jgi:hypothetical protein
LQKPLILQGKIMVETTRRVASTDVAPERRPSHTRNWPLNHKRHNQGENKMAKKAVTTQERLEKLIAGANANPDGPTLDVAALKGLVDTLNGLEYQVSQAKLALSQAVKTRNAQVKDAVDTIVKAELAVKSHYGPRSAKVKEFVLPADKPRAKPKA